VVACWTSPEACAALQPRLLAELVQSDAADNTGELIRLLNKLKQVTCRAAPRPRIAESERAGRNAQHAKTVGAHQSTKQSKAFHNRSNTLPMLSVCVVCCSAYDALRKPLERAVAVANG
jgi:hypothetical protein